MDLRYVALATLSPERLAAALHAVYQGYFYPSHQTAAQVQERSRRESWQLEHSVLALEGSQPVGLSVLAMRGRRGWIGSFGITPERRGKGLARPLLATAVERARDAGVAHLSLEVLTRNQAAVRTYEQGGFHTTRELAVLTGAAPNNARLDQETAAAVSEAAAIGLLSLSRRWHQAPPAWQREPEGLLATPGLKGLRLHKGDGYLVYTQGERPRIVDLAVSGAPHQRAAGVTLLLRALAPRTPGVRVSLVNEPDNEGLLPTLLAAGFREVDRQYEMHQDLSQP